MQITWTDKPCVTGVIGTIHGLEGKSKHKVRQWVWCGLDKKVDILKYKETDKPMTCKACIRVYEANKKRWMKRYNKKKGN